VTPTRDSGTGSIRYFDLHRNPARRAYLTSGQLGIHADPVLGWVVDDPALVTDLLADSRLRVIDYGNRIRRVRSDEAKLENSLFVARFMPLFLEGEAHRERRRDLAKLLGERRSELVKALPSFVANRFGPLSRTGTVDVMNEILVPLLADIGTVILGVDPRRLRVQAISGIFDRLKGLRRIERLDADIGDVRAAIRAELGVDIEEEGLILTLLVLSHDTLLGTLGGSLRQVFEDAAGKPINQTTIPELPPETGVPFVERECREEMTVRGHRLAKGAFVRLIMMGFAYSARPADQGRIFGAGTHTCLGKRLALDVWGSVAGKLAELGQTIDVVEYAPRTSDNVFACPSVLRVKVS
jgi:cytochrome P450